jgi:hypothetical protein
VSVGSVAPCRRYARPVTGRAGTGPVAVLDIDGVLADVAHRLHHLAMRPKDWESFFRSAARDPVLEDGRELARELAATYALVYLTGRPARSRDLTVAWLRRHRLPSGELLMRPDDDRRPARLFKLECLATISATRPVVLVVDDDPEVVDAVRQTGLAVRLADWSPYTDPLRAAQETDGRT